MGDIDWRSSVWLPRASSPSTVHILPVPGLLSPTPVPGLLTVSPSWKNIFRNKNIPSSDVLPQTARSWDFVFLPPWSEPQSCFIYPGPIPWPIWKVHNSFSSWNKEGLIRHIINVVTRKPINYNACQLYFILTSWSEWNMYLSIYVLFNAKRCVSM